MRAARAAKLAARSSSIPSFAEYLNLRGLPPLTRAPLDTVMVNIGKLCNLACRHCHVESSPARVKEQMDARTVARLLDLLREAAPRGVTTLDVTGGAPEMNANFRDLVRGARAAGLAVTDRCNLSVLLLEGQEDTPTFLAENSVRVVASLPALDAPAVDAQRGAGAWDASLRGLRRLAAAGYGDGSAGLRLDLVYNPAGARLPPPQAELEATYRARLRDEHGLHFGSLLALANMPIRRFADDLARSGEYEAYMGLLAANFNADVVPALMCRTGINVAHDGALFDCDFNGALDEPLGGAGGTLWTIDSLVDAAAASSAVATTKACYGCTAGDGSSCGGALAVAR